MRISSRISRWAAIGLLALVAACSSSPSVDMEEWNITPQSGEKDTYRFTASTRLRDGQGGWFSPDLLLTDERGCLVRKVLNPINPVGAADPSDVDGQYNETFNHGWRIASARLTINHTTPEGSGFAENEVLNDHKVINPEISPPQMPEKPCTTADRPTRDELRERAKTDPDGADAEAISNMSKNEIIATAINSAGFLCARIIDAEARGNMIIARCVEYRNGSGRARYSIDLADMTVLKLS